MLLLLSQIARPGTFDYLRVPHLHKSYERCFIINLPCIISMTMQGISVLILFFESVRLLVSSFDLMVPFPVMIQGISALFPSFESVCLRFSSFD